MDRLSALGAGQPGMTQLTLWQIAVGDKVRIYAMQELAGHSKGCMHWNSLQNVSEKRSLKAQIEPGELGVSFVNVWRGSFLILNSTEYVAGHS